ncbi:receptor activity-modifying protein 3 isoform X1 [Meleagris gallopavo]|uniref:receptor activity-modifying protein 3 isoform X1 n=1 Tax=Meleagris gallopavo TaxID=9103 RepID=UPI00093C8D08|nr:receptor activity-modifying protein 3 isoform X1 [Meleagris gallopavo]
MGARVDHAAVHLHAWMYKWEHAYGCALSHSGTCFGRGLDSMISGAPFQLLWVQVGARMCAYGCTRAHARMRTHVHPHTRGHRHAPAHRAVQCRKRPHTLAHAPGSPASPAQVLAARPALPPPQEHPEGGDAAFSRDRPPGREAEPALWERVRRPWHCAATDRPPHVGLRDGGVRPLPAAPSRSAAVGRAKIINATSLLAKSKM